VGFFWNNNNQSESNFKSTIQNQEAKNYVPSLNDPNTDILKHKKKEQTLTTPSDQFSFQEHFNRITKSIGTITENPEEADLEISNLAMTLDRTQLNELYTKVISKYSNGDEKLLAVELLSRSSLPETIEHLKNIASSSASESSYDSSLTQQEFQSLQVSAIEGLTQKPQLKHEAKLALNSLSQSTDNTLLLDRIKRAQAALDGRAPSPEAQDKAALEQVLKIQK